MSALCNYAGLLKRSREENHLGGAGPSSAQSVDDGVSGAPPQTPQVMPHILYACERGIFAREARAAADERCRGGFR